MRASKLFARLGIAALVVVALLVTALAALIAVDSGSYLIYLATRGDIIDVWAVFSLMSLVFAVVGVAGAWWFLVRKRAGLAAIFLLLPFPAHFLTEANRCDIVPFCEATDWARLPPGAFAWSVRIRDVDVHTAKHLANAALGRAGLKYWAWDPRLTSREWRVETRNDDMERGPYDVIVDARTGHTRIVRR